MIVTVTRESARTITVFRSDFYEDPGWSTARSEEGVYSLIRYFRENLRLSTALANQYARRALLLKIGKSFDFDHVSHPRWLPGVVSDHVAEQIKSQEVPDTCWYSPFAVMDQYNGTYYVYRPLSTRDLTKALMTAKDLQQRYPDGDVYIARIPMTAHYDKITFDLAADYL